MTDKPRSANRNGKLDKGMGADFLVGQVTGFVTRGGR
ncbi:hypothetical protein SAMN06265370_101397 [Puniceibacterium sediminis]|uniref:Uncharacterized protein n=1 Tax=Puniceibacterium sediminis TaxID=1608407 RepID=A0A238UZE6_9RHOB|nr:hypothetical protein SAMN06265370_101397 [Puniceibacterium sediminis]